MSATGAAVAPPHNLDAEEAVLGAVFLSDTVLGRLIEEGLRPEHFYRDTHRTVYAAMLELFDASERVDPITVAAKGVDELEVAALAGSVPHAGAFLSYAKTVLECYDLRRKRAGALLVLEGVDKRDSDRVAEGERTLTAGRVQTAKRTSEPWELAEDAYKRLEGGEPETFKWPLERMNKLTAGGMRRGQLTVIAAHTSFGKSILIDACLQSGAREGLRVGLFLNEMTKAERTDRMLARLSRVPLQKIMLNRLTTEERAKVVDALPHLPFSITDASGWTAQEIARDVMVRGLDLVAVDIFNRLPHMKLEQKDESSRVLNQLTKESQGNCHLLLGAHLNRNRTGQSMILPAPAISDLRDTGMLERDADNVLLIHREQNEETGDPLAIGGLRFSKVRSGRRGAVRVKFMDEFMDLEATGPSAVEKAA